MVCYPSTWTILYELFLHLFLSLLITAFQSPTRDDTLRVILLELDGVPHIGNDELNDARDTAIELQLTNRFAHVKGKS